MRRIVRSFLAGIGDPLHTVNRYASTAISLRTAFGPRGFETAGQFYAFSKEVLSSNVYSLNYDEDGLGYFHDASIGLLSDVLVEVSQYHQLAGMAIYLFDRLFIFLNWDFQEPFVVYKVDNEEEFVALEATTNAALNVVCWPEQTILSACFGLGHGNEHLQATTLVLVHFWLTYRNERQTREFFSSFRKIECTGEYAMHWFEKILAVEACLDQR